MPNFPPIGHVALTVRDLSVSTPWYVKLVGADPAMTLSDGPFERKVFALPGGQLLGITQHENSGGAGTFDPTHAGMDHLGFACADRSAVEAWARHLDEVGISHDGVTDAEYGTALSFKDPDGNALEFFAAGG